MKFLKSLFKRKEKPVPTIKRLDLLWVNLALFQPKELRA